MLDVDQAQDPMSRRVGAEHMCLLFAKKTALLKSGKWDSLIPTTTSLAGMLFGNIDSYTYKSVQHARACSRL